MQTMVNQMLWNQKRHLKGAFLFAGKPAPTSKVGSYSNTKH